MRISGHEQVRGEIEMALRRHLRWRRRAIIISLIVIPILAGLTLATSGTLTILSTIGLVVYMAILVLMAWSNTFSLPDEEWHYKFALSIFFGKSLTGKYSPKTIFAIFQRAMLVEGWQRDPIERAILRACQKVRVVYQDFWPYGWYILN